MTSMSSGPSTPGGLPRLRWVVAASYAVGLGLLVFTPINWALNRLTVRMYIFFRTRVPIAPDWMLPEHYGDLLNVLLFVPMGVLVMVWRRRWWSSALICALTSAGIEVIQAIPVIDRQPSLVDIVCNTTGGLLGVVATRAWMQRSGKHQPPLRVIG